jgi:hypothetical protein
MRVEELEAALHDVAAEQAPVHVDRQVIERRVRRRRARVAVVVAVAAVIGLVTTIAVSGPWRGSPDEQVRTGAHAQETQRIPEPVRRCFPVLAEPSSADMSEQVDAPHDLADLLVLTDSGDVYVVRGGEMHRWTAAHTYLWAQWDRDGTILGSRLATGDDAVVIDRLLAPGEARGGVATLPYTVKPGAPKGSCPIDGYLATFAVGPSGVVVLRHTPGPLPHSCPAMPPPGPGETTDPWRCQSPEATSLERRTGDLSRTGQDLGSVYGGLRSVVNASTRSDSVAYLDAGTVTIERPGNGGCCFGGVRTTAAAPSPDGAKAAYAAGAEVRVAPTVVSHGGGERTLWWAPGPVDALAWSGTEVAVASGGRLFLVSAVDRTVVELTSRAIVGHIRSLDFAS